MTYIGRGCEKCINTITSTTSKIGMIDMRFMTKTVLDFLTKKTEHTLVYLKIVRTLFNKPKEIILTENSMVVIIVLVNVTMDKLVGSPSARRVT